MTTWVRDWRDGDVVEIEVADQAKRPRGPGWRPVEVGEKARIRVAIPDGKISQETSRTS